MQEYKYMLPCHSSFQRLAKLKFLALGKWPITAAFELQQRWNTVLAHSSMVSAMGALMVPSKCTCQQLSNGV